MNCQDSRQQFALYIYGELTFDEEEQLEAHLDSCPDCKVALEHDRRILLLASESPVDPPPDLLERCRAGLKQQLPYPASPERKSVFAFLRAWIPSPRIWKPVAAFAALAIAFSLGRGYEERASVVSAASNSVRIRTVQGGGDGTVQIVLEEPRQRVIEGGLQDERIQRALLAASRQAPDPGMRLESVDLLRNRCNRDDVRQVMLQSLEKDESPLVRLRALEALRPYASDAAVRKSLSRVLLVDSNPTVRVQAIDLLVDHAPDDFVDTLQQVIRRDDNDYIRGRCLRALTKMRASPGVF